MKVNVPELAPFGPPEIGESTKYPFPDAATASETLREVGTSIVEHSMNSFLLAVGEAAKRPVLELVNAS